MPMTDAGLSAAIKAKLESNFTFVDMTQLQNFCDDLGAAIVEYIQANVTVEPGTFTTPSGAVTGTGTVT